MSTGMSADFNVGFADAVDVRANDIVVLQATRIVRRKAIELAVDLDDRAPILVHVFPQVGQ